MLLQNLKGNVNARGKQAFRISDLVMGYPRNYRQSVF